MPTQEEKKCCTTVMRASIAKTALLLQIIMDANVLDVARRYVGIE